MSEILGIFATMIVSFFILVILFSGAMLLLSYSYLLTFIILLLISFLIGSIAIYLERTR